MLLASTMSATTINVPADQPSIQSAIDVATSGDTVSVAPGVYLENLIIAGKAVNIFGAGADSTTIQPSTNGSPTVIFANITSPVPEFSGFTVTGGGAVVTFLVEDATCVVSNNVFHDNIPVGSSNIEVISCIGATATIKRNIFYNNGGIGCVGLRPGSENSVIVNNTFDSNERGFFSIANGGTAINNIVTNSIERGVGSVDPTNFTTLDYNDIWNNNPDYDIAGVEGSNSIHIDPQYVDPVSNDYQLLLISPCIDAGDPVPIYNDPDGSRNDIGAKVLIRSMPLARSINLGAEDLFHILSSNPTFFWSYFDTSATSQSAYELEVGTDNEWSVAEMWATGQVFVTDTSVVYAGAPLVAGITYFVRIRVNNGAVWGDWTSQMIHTNVAPAPAPIPLHPIDGELVNINMVNLFVLNSSDADSEPLVYDFEIYNDFALTNLVSQTTGAPEGADSTGSGIQTGLFANQEYWWRCRASDGFEFSGWSAVKGFKTVTSVTIHVPADQPTIQQAIDVATVTDTIAVAPGVYTENLAITSKSVKIIGSGPAVTILQPSLTGNPTVTFSGGSASGSEFRGFTVTGGGPDKYRRPE